jgi:hypothetical protein
MDTTDATPAESTLNRSIKRPELYRGKRLHSQKTEVSSFLGIAPPFLALPSFSYTITYVA